MKKGGRGTMKLHIWRKGFEWPVSIAVGFGVGMIVVVFFLATAIAKM